MILPILSESLYTCIVINRESGICKSFGPTSQVSFEGNLACLDPYYDVIWKYSNDPPSFKCYNIMLVDAKNLKECSLYDSSYMKDTFDKPFNQVINFGRRSLSILSCELAIPRIDGCFTTRYQLAIHLLACLDTYYTFHSQK